jgi:hypothetical protein
MASLINQASASGTGSVTLLAPVTNSTQTLTLPDATGTLFVTAAGTVLQAVSFANDAGGSTSATSLTNTSASVKTITPKSTNSILLVTAQFTGQSGFLGAVNTAATFQLMESAVGIGISTLIEIANNSGGNRITAPCSISARLTNTALTARSFTLGALTSNASASAAATNQIFTIMEIQQ